MKRFITLLLVCAVMFGCATTDKTTTARTLLTMHDFMLTASRAADTLCKKGQISATDCQNIKKVYGSFRLAWPILDDAMVAYLQTDGKDAQVAFQNAYGVFIQDYNQLFNLLIQTGAVKKSDGGTQ